MYKIVESWLSWHVDYGNIEFASDDAIEWHTKVSDCIKQIADGEEIIDDRKSEIALIWNLVNFLNSINDEMSAETHVNTLQAHMNLYTVLFRHMSFLTYREILELFPVLIHNEDGKKYFDGSDIYFNADESCFSSPSLDEDVIGLLTLCGCGIHLVDEDIDILTDFNAIIGDNIMEFVANNMNKIIRLLYFGFLDVTASLSTEISHALLASKLGLNPR